MLVANFGQTYFGADDPTGHGPIGSSPAFDSIEQIAAFVTDYVTWLAESEAAINEAFKLLLYQVVQGVASCDELNQFNAQSIALFNRQNQLLGKFDALRDSFPQLPRNIPAPPLFAHSAVISRYLGVDTINTKDVQLTCMSNGKPDPVGLQIIGPGARACPTNGDMPRAQLGTPVVAVLKFCATKGTAAVACLLGAAIISGLVYISTSGAAKIVREFGRVFSKADEIAARTDMQRVIAAQERQSLEFVNKCFEGQIGKLPAAQNTADARDRIMSHCRAAARESGRAAPHEPLGLGAWIAIGAIGVGVTAATVAIVKARRHRGDS